MRVRVVAQLFIIVSTYSVIQCYFLITSRYSNKVLGAVFIIIAIIVIVGLATMKNEYKECSGMSCRYDYVFLFLLLVKIVMMV